MLLSKQLPLSTDLTDRQRFRAARVGQNFLIWRTQQR